LKNDNDNENLSQHLSDEGDKLDDNNSQTNKRNSRKQVKAISNNSVVSVHPSSKLATINKDTFINQV